MTKRFNVAVLGATGLVGEAIISILAERNFPINRLYPLASENSLGQTVLYGSKALDVIDAATFDFSNAQVAIFSAGASVSAEYAPKAAAAGCVVIDNTSEFRCEKDIPLVVPEVNPDKVGDYIERNIIANPNCSTIQMVVALKPIYDAVGIEEINVSTYQSVSGSGRSGVSELVKQAGKLLNGQAIDTEVYPKQIAFNVLPHIDKFMDNGFTKEEMKMVWETRKILDDDQIVVNPTAVRVPVIYGHSEAIHLELRKPLSAKDAKALLAKAPGVKVVDQISELDYPTPISDAIGEDMVCVGRIRNQLDNNYGLNLWVVSDNIRKGAALNSVQIAEILVNKYLVL